MQAERVVAARELTSGPLGLASICLCRNQCRHVGDVQGVRGRVGRGGRTLRRCSLRPAVRRRLGAKLDVVHDLRPGVVSFTFGLPTTDGLSRLKRAGITTVATVTAVEEAEAAVSRGADAVVAQGPVS